MSGDSELFTLPPVSGATGDVLEAYTRVWRRVAITVELDARDLSQSRVERAELLQEARLRLWKIEPSRCDITEPQDVRYIHSILYNHMRKVLAKKRKEEDKFVDLVPPDLARELDSSSRLPKID